VLVSIGMNPIEQLTRQSLILIFFPSAHFMIREESILGRAGIRRPGSQRDRRGGDKGRAG